MKNLKKKLAARGGFTLVELIVVIAILAILAGVAVPVYSGYIKKANDAAVTTELSAVLTAAQAANATNTVGIAKIEVTGAGVVTVTLGTGGTLAADYYATFAAFHSGATATKNTSATVTGLNAKLAKSSYASGATWYATASTTQGSEHAAGWVAGS